MDSIQSVENEVEKVIRLFYTCRESCQSKIDQLIELLLRTKKEIDDLAAPNQSELNMQQSILIRNACDTIQKSCAQITNSHRELHIPVSKIGKSIDKNFSADFASVADAYLFQLPENKHLLNQAIVQHFLCHEMVGIAEELLREAKLSIDKERLMEFYEFYAILGSLKNKDLSLALEWAIKNRKSLRELSSPLEFKIHRINIIELYKQGIEKQHDIIQYARDNLQHLDSIYNLEIQHLMGGMIYLKTGIENSPYKSFLDPVDYGEIRDIFLSNACALLNLGVRSPISVAVEAGSIAFPALLNINQILSSQGVQNIWQLRDELPVEIDLGRQLQFHSTFSCPILKQQSTESNPPMRLVCGHVISRDALHKLSSTTTGIKLKCPYCPMEQVLSDAMLIHF